MIEGSIIKSVVLQDSVTGGTVLMGVAAFEDRRVNFKVPYDWDNLDYKWFAKELRNVLARDLDISVKRMDIREKETLGKMKAFSQWNKKGAL